MSRRKPDNDPIHDEMLRHLEDHPPPRRRPEQPAPPPPARPASAPQPQTPPHLNLRRMRLDPALDQLARFVTQHQRRGTPEVLVVVGKGHGSSGGEPVIAPAARAWLDRRSDLVASV